MRKARGKALRARRPRGRQAGWSLRRREGDLVPRLLAAVEGRRTDLLPIRWGRMAASPFGFFRGAAALMAEDLGPLPSSGLEVQLCGDAHLLNLGAYAAPDGHLVFDLNDFDETCRGPFEWDLKRLATSFAVGGRVAGLSDPACAAAVRAVVEAYREGLDRFSRLRVLELARLELGPRRGAGPLAAIFRQAARNGPQVLVERHTVPDGGGFARFRARPPLLVPLRPREARPVLAALRDYLASLGPGRRQVVEAYAPRDLAFKVVGTGSVGVLDHVALLYGNGPRDPLFLQVKEADDTCWRRWLKGRRARPEPAHHGRRVAEGQLRTQTVSDPFLGWTSASGRDFIVRQWGDHKGSLDVRALGEGEAEAYAALCGEVLAKAHARTGDAAMLAGYCGRGSRLDRALARFALDYADQTEADHAGLVRAIAGGRLEAREP
ncbi:MAG TPA: DUF2252 domain-containing protein [Anaeromyxobacteraceae bacterium]|nr:DUF2252 domain-containing protein [Anaeromyxobacteraceae bacterium]